MNLPPLTTLVPIRDRRDRTAGYALLSAPSDNRQRDEDEHVHELLELVPKYSRMVGRSLLVPVTPSVLRDGSLTRIASLDAVYLVATDALEDAPTRRAIERLGALGIRFAFEGQLDPGSLSPMFRGAIVAFDARSTPPAKLGYQIRVAVDGGLQPLVRGVDDRASRLRVLNDGAAMHMGLLLCRSASTSVNASLRSSVVHTIRWLAAASEGKPMDTRIDSFVLNNPHASAALLKVVGSAAIGIGTPRSVPHAISLLGRESVLELMAIVAARLVGDVANDPELATTALRRVRLCERIGTSLDAAPHPRARAVAGLLSVLEYALSAPSVHLQQQDFAELSPLFTDVLVNRNDSLGQLVDLVDALEFGWWSDVHSRCTKLGVHPGVVASAYAKAWREARDDLAVSRETS